MTLTSASQIKIGACYLVGKNSKDGAKRKTMVGACYLVEAQLDPTTYRVTSCNPSSTERKLFRRRAINVRSLLSYHLVPASDEQIPDLMRPIVEACRAGSGHPLPSIKTPRREGLRPQILVGAVYVATRDGKHVGRTGLAGAVYLIEAEVSPGFYQVSSFNPNAPNLRLYRGRVVSGNSLNYYGLQPASDEQIPGPLRPIVSAYRARHGATQPALPPAPAAPPALILDRPASPASSPVESAPAQTVAPGLIPLAVPSETVALLKKLVARKNEQIAALGLDVQVDAASVLHGIVKTALAAETAALAAQ